MIKVERYKDTDKNAWNNFLEESKNQTFLFNRNYMDYHSNRFSDYSLMVYDNDKLAALIPANLQEGIIISHEGLSYGGCIVERNTYSDKVLEYWSNVLKFLHEQGIKKFLFKQIPVFYNSIGAEETDYALFVVDAKIYRTDIASVIVNDCKIPYQERKKRGIKKAILNNIQVAKDNNFNLFWEQVLIPNLRERYKTNPVHSIEEIISLKETNPFNIHQFNAYYNKTIVAGCTIFETETTAHAQYISASELGKNLGALDFLFDFLISKEFARKKYFDFGIVNENSGKLINKGLLQWKEGFGARSFAHRFYEIETIKYSLIEELIK